MSLPVILGPLANADVRHFHAELETQVPGLGEMFLDRLQDRARHGLLKEEVRMNNFGRYFPMTEIANFCQHWKIEELALFGSVLRDDFTPESDVDILITFSTDADWGLLEHFKMQQELQKILHRNIDLISKRGIENSSNWLRRNEILKTAKTLFSQRKALYASG